MTTPLSALRQRVDAGILNADPEQERAAIALTDLSDRLAAWRPERKKLFGKPDPAPTGL